MMGPPMLLRARLIAGVDQRSDQVQVGRGHLHGVGGCVPEITGGSVLVALL